MLPSPRSSFIQGFLTWHMSLMACPQSIAWKGAFGHSRPSKVLAAACFSLCELNDCIHEHRDQKRLTGVVNCLTDPRHHCPAGVEPTGVTSRISLVLEAVPCNPNMTVFTLQKHHHHWSSGQRHCA
jgi:hypothetical protein